jgi:hypothetical protein
MSALQDSTAEGPTCSHSSDCKTITKSAIAVQGICNYGASSKLEGNMRKTNLIRSGTLSELMAQAAPRAINTRLMKLISMCCAF